MGHLDSQRSLPVYTPAQGGLSQLARKLRFAPGQSIAVLNSPDGYLEQLRPELDGLSTQLAPSQAYDAVQLFVRDKAELSRLGAPAVEAVKPNGLLWITYPKGGVTRGETDLPATPWWVRNDVLGELTGKTGYRPVAFVAVDGRWTALRFKPL